MAGRIHYLIFLPFVLGTFSPHNNLPIIRTRSQNAPELGMRPCHLPHRTFMPGQACERHCRHISRADGEHLYQPIWGTRRHSLTIVIHGHIVHHILVPWLYHLLTTCVLHSPCGPHSSTPKLKTPGTHNAQLASKRSK